MQPCPSCSTPVQAGLRFCGACGAATRPTVPRSAGSDCRSCGAAIVGTQPFCGACGAKVERAQSPVFDKAAVERITAKIDPFTIKLLIEMAKIAGPHAIENLPQLIRQLPELAPATQTLLRLSGREDAAEWVGPHLEALVEMYAEHEPQIEGFLTFLEQAGPHILAFISIWADLPKSKVLAEAWQE